MEKGFGFYDTNKSLIEFLTLFANVGTGTKKQNLSSVDLDIYGRMKGGGVARSRPNQQHNM